MALRTAVPIPSHSPQTVAMRSTPGMKTIPSETGSAAVSSAATIPVPTPTTTIAARMPSAVEGALGLSRNTKRSVAPSAFALCRNGYGKLRTQPAAGGLLVLEGFENVETGRPARRDDRGEDAGQRGEGEEADQGRA